MCLCSEGILGAHALSDRGVSFFFPPPGSGYLSYMTKSLRSVHFNATSGELLPILWPGWFQSATAICLHSAQAPMLHFDPLFTTLVGLLKQTNKNKQNQNTFLLSFQKWGNMVTPDPFPLCPSNPFSGSSRVTFRSVHASTRRDVDNSRALGPLSDAG